MTTTTTTSWTSTHVYYYHFVRLENHWTIPIIITVLIVCLMRHAFGFFLCAGIWCVGNFTLFIFLLFWYYYIDICAPHVNNKKYPEAKNYFTLYSLCVPRRISLFFISVVLLRSLCVRAALVEFKISCFRSSSYTPHHYIILYNEERVRGMRLCNYRSGTNSHL